MEIFYCETCGHRVSEIDIDSGAALVSQDNVYCEHCVESREDLKSLHAKRSRSEIPEAKKRVAAEARKRHPSGVLLAGKKRAALPGLVFAVAAVLLVAAAILTLSLTKSGSQSGTGGAGRKLPGTSPAPRPKRARSMDDVFGVPQSVQKPPERTPATTARREEPPAAPRSSRRTTEADEEVAVETLDTVEAIKALAGDPAALAALNQPDAGEAEATGPGEASEAETPASRRDAALRRGVECARSEDVRGAARAFEAAIKIDPGHAKAYNNLGALLLEEGRWEEAEKNLLRAIELDPEFGEAYLNLGLLCEAQWRDEEATARIRRGLELAPQLATVILARLKEVDDGHLKALAADGPKDFAQAMWLARRKYREEDWRGALAGARKAAEFDSESAEALYVMGLIYEETGNRAGAIRSYGKAARLDPNHFRALNNMAWIYATSSRPPWKNPEAAVRNAEKANAASGGENAAVLDTLARSLAAARDHARALEVARKAAALAPDDAEIQEYARELEARAKR